VFAGVNGSLGATNIASRIHFQGWGRGTVCIVALYRCTGGRSDAQRHWKL